MPVVTTSTVRVTSSHAPGESPLGGSRVSQGALLVANQFKVLSPEFRINKVWVDGFGPPSLAEKQRLSGLKSMVGHALGVGVAAGAGVGVGAGMRGRVPVILSVQASI